MWPIIYAMLGFEVVCILAFVAFIATAQGIPNDRF